MQEYTGRLQHFHSNTIIADIPRAVYFRYCNMLHYRLFQITPADYDEFVNYLFHARMAFTWSCDGMTSFNHLLGTIKR